MAVVFWRDMVLVGTAVNLGASFAALILVAQGVATAVAVAVHFAPLPYNLWLFAVVWRLGRRPPWMPIAAGAWLLAAALL